MAIMSKETYKALTSDSVVKLYKDGLTFSTFEKLAEFDPLVRQVLEHGRLNNTLTQQQMLVLYALTAAYERNPDHGKPEERILAGEGR